MRINGSGDLGLDPEARKFIGKQCAVIRKTKSGLYEVVLLDDLSKKIIIPKRNIDG